MPRCLVASCVKTFPAWGTGAVSVRWQGLRQSGRMGLIPRAGQFSHRSADAGSIVPGLWCDWSRCGVVLSISRIRAATLRTLCTGPFLIIWLIFRRKRRFAKFGKQIPDALGLIARALRSGHSLNAGLHMVAEEMAAPISAEFSRAYEEQNLGVPIETALKSMLKRMPNLDLKFFVTAVSIQRQTGGDLAEIIDKICEVVRERFKILGMVQALTGEGRLSGAVLMGLPIVLFIAVCCI